MKFKIFHDVSTKIFPYCWKKHPDLDANNTAGKAIVNGRFAATMLDRGDPKAVYFAEVEVALDED